MDEMVRKQIREWFKKPEDVLQKWRQDYQNELSELERIRSGYQLDDFPSYGKDVILKLAKDAVDFWGKYYSKSGRSYLSVQFKNFEKFLEEMSNEEYEKFKDHLYKRIREWENPESVILPFEYPSMYGMLVPILRLYHPDCFIPHVEEKVRKVREKLNLRNDNSIDVLNYDLLKHLKQAGDLQDIPTPPIAYFIHEFATMEAKLKESENPPPADRITPGIAGPAPVDRWATDHDFRRRYPNLILYGPPGTGKTFIAGQVAKRFQSQEGPARRPSRENWEFEQVQKKGLRWIDVIALALYDKERGDTRNLTVPDLRRDPWIEAKKNERTRKRNVEETLWATLQAHAEAPTTYAKRIDPLIFVKDDQSRWRLNQVGKNLASDLWERLHEEEGAGEGTAVVTMITFHPSYSYEDFIEGLRPVTGKDEEDPGELRYEVYKGVFRNLCETARMYPDRDFLLVIDEINRGNIAKVFGELITLIETDKRFTYDSERGTWKNERFEPIRLPLSGDDFFVPDNVFLLGTMNSADRSIALIDLALRRRFAFIELMPDVRVLREGLANQGHLESGLDIPALVEKVNQRIADKLDRDHAVGHSYFLDERLCRESSEDERQETLWEVWTFQITPLLEEYFYGKDERLREVFDDRSGLIEVGTGEPPIIHMKRFTNPTELIDALTRWTSPHEFGQ